MINSYNPTQGARLGDDALLEKMRFNDWSLRANNVWNHGKHYERDLTRPGEDRFRTTEDEGMLFDEHRLDQIPAMMLEGHRRLLYGHHDLNQPIGAIDGGPLGLASVDAKGLGWGDERHSDGWLVYMDDDAGRWMWYPEIYVWWTAAVEPNITTGQE